MSCESQKWQSMIELFGRLTDQSKRGQISNITSSRISARNEIKGILEASEVALQVRKNQHEYAFAH
jgi:hypothetical protein